MREILFKGKHVHVLPQNVNLDGVWVWGYLSDKDHILCQDIGEEFLVDSETVCQYTGLTDKNGRKIFEGDIIQYDFGDDQIGVQLAKVQYDVNHHGFLINPYNDWMFVRLQECTVVGNVFDIDRKLE